MPIRESTLVAKTRAVLKKDLAQELRTRYALNAIILFGITTLTVVSLSVSQASLSGDVHAALLWIIILFSAMSGLSQVFVREEESRTAQALRLYGEPTPVYLGKLAFNLFLLVVLDVILVPLYLLMAGPDVRSIPLFLIVLILGSVGLAGATTLIAAVIARASIKGALFAALSFPVLLPLLIGAVNGTGMALTQSEAALFTTEIQLLISYDVVMITAGILLFEYVWEE